MQFQREKFITFFDEALPLFRAHFNEVQDYFEGKKDLDPDVETYLKLDEAGYLRVYTARESGLLIGYCIHQIFNHLHFCD
jgi:hypothetical protein